MPNDKSIKRSISLAIFKKDAPNKLLLVKRPEDDPELPGLWGLPAASFRPGESLSDVAERIGKDKLGAKLIPGKMLRRGTQERAEYILEMELYLAHMEGSPDLPKATHRDADITLYDDWRWATPKAIEPSAEKGSLCSQLLLEHLRNQPTEVVVKFHEMSLKGRNRPMFIRKLISNIQQATSDLDVAKVRQGPMMVRLSLGHEANWDVVKDRLRKRFGIAKFFRAYSMRKELDEVEKKLPQLLEGRSFSSFRITAHRADKSFPMTSVEINRRLGAYVKEKTGAKVVLGKPDLEIFVDVLHRETLVYFEEIPAYGGLPVGTGGRVLTLMSGGIDSPVAAWHMMKRGCQTVLLHFHSHPLVDTSSIEKAIELAELLTAYQLETTLYLVPLAEVQKQILARLPAPYRVIMYRRFMVRIAEAMARREHCLALVTGESLGQVASQTLENLSVIDEVCQMPIFRPLIGFNKQEIIDKAMEIGTYETSILPDQDCCSLFVPQNPVTRSNPEEVRKLESLLPVDELVQQAIAEVQVKRFTFPK